MLAGREWRLRAVTVMALVPCGISKISENEPVWSTMAGKPFISTEDSGTVFPVT